MRFSTSKMTTASLRTLTVALTLGVLTSAVHSAPPAAPSQSAPVERSLFGRMPDGTAIDCFTLTNRHGLVAKVITFGAILADLRVPDRDGKLASVVREIVASEQGFQRGFPGAGAVFGRVANRIARARFTLDGREYQLAANNGPNHIHGGARNFSRVVWQANTVRHPRRCLGAASRT